MKTQISRLSPHQNGKVFGILMAVTTLAVGVPIFTLMFFMNPSVAEKSRASNVVLFAPCIVAIVYLILGYVTGLIGSAIYNILYKYIGGFEFEQKDRET
jgi:subtilase family serine protease